MCVKMMTSENEKSHGSLFLRIGAVAFGLGTLIYTGLEFLTFFEVPPNCMEWGILEGVNPVLYMIFVFMQMYFIFTHARINVNKNKFVAKFGMMHIVATNMCIVIRTLVKESAKELLNSEGLLLSFENNNSSSSVNSSTSRNTTAEGKCEKFDIIGDTMENSSLYLFPFIIEYSIIGSAVIYRMWSHIGKNPTYVVVGKNKSQNHKEEIQLKSQRDPLDWSNSSTGLFMGLLSLVTLIISLILYFALVNQDPFKLLAILINNITDLLVNASMIFVIILGFSQTRHLKLVRGEKDYDMVMVVTAFGIVVYATFTVIAGTLNDNSFEPGWLIVISGIVELIEVNMQLLFIADLRQKKISEEDSPKYGRQTVTYLLICNLALWITYNFEIQKVNATPDQVEFYGFLPWVVIQRITLPLCVFFRFHSTVVLAELWKNCYRLKKSELE